MNSSELAGQINILAVIVAAISATALGGIWYSRLVFGPLWMRENGFTAESAGKTSLLKIYVLTFICSLVASCVLCFSLVGTNGMLEGIMAGSFAGLGWVATFTAIHYLFESRSFKLYLINAGFSLLALMLMGAILGTWK